MPMKHYLLKFCLIILIILACTGKSLSYSDYEQFPHHPQPEHSNERISVPKPGWVDPFDMLGGTLPSDSLFVQSDVEIHLLKNRCGNYEVYLRRFINMFLHAVELRDTPVSMNSMNFVKLQFWIHGSDLKILKEFGKGGSNAPKIEEVSSVYDKIFSQKTPQERSIFTFSQIVTWLQKTLLKILSSPEWTVFSSVSLLLILTLWIIFKTHSYRMALFMILLTIFLSGFGFTWIRMYEEKEVERYANIQLHGEVPKHCSGQPMAWYEHIFFRMFGVNCLEFYKSRDIRPIVKISPTDVLAETFSSMIVNPAYNVGAAYGNYVSNCIGHLPFWLKPFGLPIAFITPLLFLLLLMAFLFNYRMSLSITGFHMSPSSSAHNPQIDMRENNRYIENFPRKENESLQQRSAFSSILSESNTPLFIMNWMGLKKLSSKSLLEKNKKKEEEIQDKENHSVKEENEDKVEDLIDFTEFMVAVNSQEAIENRKKRTIHTSVDGVSSLISRSDLQNKAVIENIDFSSGDSKRALVDSTKEKDKTS